MERKFVIMLTLATLILFQGCGNSKETTDGLVKTISTTEKTESVQYDMETSTADLIEAYSEYKNAKDPKTVKPMQEQLNMDKLYDARGKLTIYENDEPVGSLIGKDAAQLNEDQYSILNRHCKLEAIYAREKVFHRASGNFTFDIKTDPSGMFFDAFYSEKFKGCYITYFWTYEDTPSEISYNIFFYPVDEGYGQNSISNLKFESGKKILLNFNEFETLAKQTLTDKYTEHYDDFSLNYGK